MSPHEQAKPQSSGAEGAGKETQIDGYKPEIVEKESEIVGKQSETVGKTSDIVGKTSESTEMMPEIVEKKAEIVEKKAEIVEKKAEIVEQKAEIVENKAEIVEKKAEIVEKKAEIVEKKPEIVEKKPEIVEKKPEIVEKAEIVEKKPDIVEKKPDIADKKPEIADKKPEIVEKNPEIVEKKAEIVEKKTEIADKKPDIVGKNPEIEGSMTKIVEKKSEKTEKKTEIAGKKTQIAGKPEIAGNKPEIVSIKPEIAGNKPEIVSIKPKIAGNKPEIVSIKPEIAGNKPEIVDKKAEDARKMLEMVTLYPSPHTHSTSSKRASHTPPYIASKAYQAKQHSTLENKSHAKIQSGWKDQLLKKCDGGGGTKISWRPGSGRHVSDGPGSYRPLTHISRTLHLQDAINVCLRRRMEPKNITSFSCIDSRTLPHDHPCSNLQVLWFGTKTIGQDENLPDWYGNVQFTVEANILLENWRYFYLVELMTTPTQTCSRILVTNTDYSAVLPPFDPRQPGGPWHTTPEGQKVLDNCSRYNFKGQNFHSHILEFMVDVTPVDEFKLLQKCEISFRNHEEAQDLSVRHVCNRHQRLKTPCPTPFPRFTTANHFFDALNLFNICILTGIPRLSVSSRKYLDEYLKLKAIQMIRVPIFMPF